MNPLASSTLKIQITKMVLENMRKPPMKNMRWFWKAWENHPWDGSEKHEKPPMRWLWWSISKSNGCRIEMIKISQYQATKLAITNAYRWISSYHKMNSVITWTDGKSDIAKSDHLLLKKIDYNNIYSILHCTAKKSIYLLQNQRPPKYTGGTLYRP